MCGRGRNRQPGSGRVWWRFPSACGPQRRLEPALAARIRRRLNGGGRGGFGTASIGAPMDMPGFAVQENATRPSDPKVLQRRPPPWAAAGSCGTDWNRLGSGHVAASAPTAVALPVWRSAPGMPWAGAAGRDGLAGEGVVRRGDCGPIYEVLGCATWRREIAKAAQKQNPRLAVANRGFVFSAVR